MHRLIRDDKNCPTTTQRAAMCSRTQTSTLLLWKQLHAAARTALDAACQTVLPAAVTSRLAILLPSQLEA